MICLERCYDKNSIYFADGTCVVLIDGSNFVYAPVAERAVVALSDTE